MNIIPESSPEEEDDLPPFRVKLVIAQCAHCRCVAYQDRDGKWKDYFHGDELTDIREITPFD